jgi:hypothetical protein
MKIDKYNKSTIFEFFWKKYMEKIKVMAMKNKKNEKNFEKSKLEIFKIVLKIEILILFLHISLLFSSFHV